MARPGRKRKDRTKPSPDPVAYMTPEQALMKIQTINPARYSLETLAGGSWRVRVNGVKEPLPIGVLPSEVRAWDGTVIGFYECKGIITQKQRWALRKFGALSKAFHDALRMMGKMPIPPGAQNIDKVAGVPDGDMDLQDFRKLWRRYDYAYSVVGDNAHKREVAAVLRDEHAISCERLRIAAERLAEHFDRR